MVVSRLMKEKSQVQSIRHEIKVTMGLSLQEPLSNDIISCIFYIELYQLVNRYDTCLNKYTNPNDDYRLLSP